jgi:hypothetical protein
MPFFILQPSPGQQGPSVSASFSSTLDRLFDAVDVLEVSVDQGKTWTPWPNATTHGPGTTARDGLQVDDSSRANQFGRRSWFKHFRLVDASPTLSLRLTLVDGTRVAAFTCPALTAPAVGGGLSQVDGLTGVDTRLNAGNFTCTPTD